MNLSIEIDQEKDGRWTADIAELPGVLAYGETREQAIAYAEALALRVIVERLENGEAVPAFTSQLFSIVVRVNGLPRKQGRYWPRCFGLAGRLSDKRVLIARWSGRIEQIMFSLFTMVMKLVR